MPRIVISEVTTQVADPALRQLVNHVFKTLRLGAEKAVAHDAQPAEFPLAAGDTIEQLFTTRLRSLPQAKREVARTRVMAEIKAPAARRTKFYRELGAVNLRSAVSIDEQSKTAAREFAKKLPAAELRTLAVRRLDLIGTEPPEPPTPPPPQPPPPQPPPPLPTGHTTHTRLALRLHQVKCVDETNGFLGSEAGDDEIKLGGVAIDPSGNVDEVEPFMVRDDFDDGEVKTYSPPKVFHTFDIGGGNVWPKSFFGTFVLAEADMGGINDFVDKLVDKIEDKVSEILAEAVGGAIGGVVGGIIGGPLGVIVGMAVGAIVGMVFDWLKSAWSDDVFEPRTVQVQLPSADATFNGSTHGGNLNVGFKGHGGEYRITYDWLLS